MDSSFIIAIYDQNIEVIDFLGEKGEVSFQQRIEEPFRKYFLISCASFLEEKTKLCLKEFFQNNGDKRGLVSNFLGKASLSRGFHTLFDWESGNANKFFSHFGEEFKDEILKKAKSDSEFQQNMHSFMEIGRERNRHIHNDIANMQLDKTAKEIRQHFVCGNKFVDDFFDFLRSYEKS